MPVTKTSGVINMKIIYFTVCSLLLWTVSCFAESEFSIFLYQPDQVIKESVGDGVKEIASFAKTVNEVWKETIPSDTDRKKSAIVVGLGFNRQTTAWIVNADADAGIKATEKLRKLKSPWIKSGYFVFALTGTDYKNKNAKEFSPPVPEEWKPVVKKLSSPSSVDNILAVLLPKSVSPENNVPDGYKIQMLEPLGGKILRPENWYYQEQHGGPRYTWTISKEDSSKGPYETGLKIQLFSGIEKGTGKTAKEFCNSFLESKASSTEVITRFPETKQGMFTRKGVEVEEKIGSKNFHIIYSVFWMGSDIAVISIAGAPQELWEEYKDNFERMSSFELIDLTRFEKKSEPKE